MQLYPSQTCFKWMHNFCNVPCMLQDKTPYVATSTPIATTLHIQTICYTIPCCSTIHHAEVQIATRLHHAQMQHGEAEWQVLALLLQYFATCSAKCLHHPFCCSLHAWGYQRAPLPFSTLCWEFTLNVHFCHLQLWYFQVTASCQHLQQQFTRLAT